MNIEEIEELTDLLFENGYDLLKTINESNKKVKENNKEIERLNHEADTYMKIAVARQKRINKALEYLDKNSFGLCYVEVAELTDILRGDKE